MKKKTYDLFISKEDNEENIEKLRSEYDRMEEIIPVFTPDLYWFEQKIENVKKIERKKFLRDLLLFWLVAITIATMTILMVNQIPMIYIIVQSIALLSFLIISIFFRKGKRVEHQ